MSRVNAPRKEKSRDRPAAKTANAQASGISSGANSNVRPTTRDGTRARTTRPEISGVSLERGRRRHRHHQVPWRTTEAAGTPRRSLCGNPWGEREHDWALLQSGQPQVKLDPLR